MTPDTQRLRAAAADEIAARGFCQHAMIDAHGRIDMLGALLLAHGLTPAEAPRDRRNRQHDLFQDDPILRQALRDMGFEVFTIAIAFNDHPGHGAHEIATRLRAGS